MVLSFVGGLDAVVHDTVEIVDNPLDASNEKLALGGERGGIRVGSVDHIEAEALLSFADMLAEGGLGDEELASRSRVVHGLTEHDELAQTIDIHGIPRLREQLCR